MSETRSSGIPQPPDIGITGIPRPNLVVEFDNQYRFQFRVQCEVPLKDEAQAMGLLEQLRSRTAAGFTKAKEIVDDVIVEYNKTAREPISDLSREIITTAFGDRIKHAKSP